MGKNTFRIEVAGITKSASIDILETKFVKGKWTSDKEGKQKLKKAQLSETVYFHVETIGITNEQEITLKLYEQDKNLFWIDWVDLDDDKFPEKEVIKKAIVKGDKAIVKLFLDERWEKMIKEDNEFLGSKKGGSWDDKLELYWKVTYGRYEENLPLKDDDYLDVTFNDRLLYFKSPIAGSKLPEFINYNGEPLLLMEMKDVIQGKLEDEIKDKIINKLSTKIGKSQRKIFFVKFDKGKIGNNINVVGALKNVGNAFNIFDLFTFTSNDIDTSKPFSLPLGIFTPLNELAGIITLQQTRDLNVYLEDALQRDLLHAKSKGLAELQKFVRVYGESDNFGLEEASKETANKLLQGEFKTMEELKEFESQSYDDRSVYILYREVKNENREEPMEVIETIIFDK